MTIPRPAWAAIAGLWLIGMTTAFVGEARQDADPTSPARRELASDIYNFLFKHALCVEETTASVLLRKGLIVEPHPELAEAPCDWVCDCAFSMHWAAKELYGNKPLKDIKMPESDYARGGYEPYLNPLVFLEHEGLKLRIWLLIKLGHDGIPPQRP